MEKEAEIRKCKDVIGHNQSLLSYKEKVNDEGDRLLEEIAKINSSICKTRNVAQFYKKLIRICEDNTARNNDILDDAASNSQTMTKDMMEEVRKRRNFNFETKVLKERMPQLLDALTTSEKIHQQMLQRLHEQKEELEVEHVAKTKLEQKRDEIKVAVEVEMNEALLLKRHARRKIVADTVQGKVQDIESRARKWHEVISKTGVSDAEEFLNKFINR